MNISPVADSATVTLLRVKAEKVRRRIERTSSSTAMITCAATISEPLAKIWIKGLLDPDDEGKFTNRVANIPSKNCKIKRGIIARAVTINDLL